MSSSEARQQRINEVISTYQRYPGDTGSSEVQGVVPVPQQPCSAAAERICCLTAPSLHPCAQ